MPLHDTSYRHWDGAHLGVWRRRLTIAGNGLTSCLRNKWMRYLLMLPWGAALSMSILLFFIGQLLVADSVVVTWVGTLNPQLQSFAKMLTAWLEQHPEISVRTTQNVLFYYFCIYLLRVGIFALGMAIPWLITRDLASNAIIIYSSKAVSRGDYLIGKFSTAFGLVGLALLAPVCAAWLMGNLLAPDWRFFWHSKTVLFHIVIFCLGSMTILSLLALGVSAIASKERSTVSFWYVWWVIGAVIVPIALQTRPWLAHLSINYNLEQIAMAVFGPGNDLNALRDSVPIFGQMMNNQTAEKISASFAPAISGALSWSLVMIAVSAVILRKRVKPE